jgi:hypothetical protein
MVPPPPHHTPHHLESPLPKLLVPLELMDQVPLMELDSQHQELELLELPTLELLELEPPTLLEATFLHLDHTEQVDQPLELLDSLEPPQDQEPPLEPADQAMLLEDQEPKPDNDH